MSSVNQLTTEYQQSVQFLKIAVDMLDNKSSIITSSNINSISNNINSLLYGMQRNVSQLENLSNHENDSHVLVRSELMPPMTPPITPPSSPPRILSSDYSPANSLSLPLLLDDSLPQVPNNRIVGNFIGDDIEIDHPNVTIRGFDINESRVPLLDLTDDFSDTFSVMDESVNDEDDAYTITNDRAELEFKYKPRVTTKFCSKKTACEHSFECLYCCESQSLLKTITLGCGHQMCVDCVESHMNASITNQPYDPYYHCPECRGKMTKLKISYSVIDGRKSEIFQSEMVSTLRPYCNVPM